jgi:hypothetical protein
VAIEKDNKSTVLKLFLQFKKDIAYEKGLREAAEEQLNRVRTEIRKSTIVRIGDENQN